MDAPSPWVVRWAHLMPQGATVLDLACGTGRHLRWLAARGYRVTGVDRDRAALARNAGLAELIEADLESGPWPLDGRQFDAVVVTNYLWRPLLPAIVGSVAEAGVLLYETFAVGHQTIGRPSNPQFLLRRGELLAAAAPLRIVAFEDGFVDGPPRHVQRVVAVREPASAGDPPRYALQTVKSANPQESE
jgi:SAM-dependent methyltransferase